MEKRAAFSDKTCPSERPWCSRSLLFLLFLLHREEPLMALSMEQPSTIYSQASSTCLTSSECATPTEPPCREIPLSMRTVCTMPQQLQEVGVVPFCCSAPWWCWAKKEILFWSLVRKSMLQSSSFDAQSVSVRIFCSDMSKAVRGPPCVKEFIAENMN